MLYATVYNYSLVAVRSGDLIQGVKTEHTVSIRCKWAHSCQRYISSQTKLIFRNFGNFGVLLWKYSSPQKTFRLWELGQKFNLNLFNSSCYPIKFGLLIRFREQLDWVRHPNSVIEWNKFDYDFQVYLGQKKSIVIWITVCKSA